MELKSLKLNKKFLLVTSALLIIALLIIILINFYPSKKSMNNLNNIYYEIEKCNKNLKDLNTSDEIDINKATDTLSTEIINLTSIKNSLNSIEISDEKNTLKTELLESLDYNLTLFNLCLNLLKNQKSTDLIPTYNEYINTYDLLLENYETLNSLGINAKFPQDAKNFFSCSSKYFSTLIKITRDSDIKVSQKSNYISSLENCINAFDKISEDLKPALNKIREDNRSFDTLLKDVKNKKSSLNEIKNNSYCLTIPENGTDCYNLLQDTISYYELYITSLEHSIIIEKTSNTDDNQKNIEENYENSFSKYSDFQDSLKNLRTELDNFNNK